MASAIPVIVLRIEKYTVTVWNHADITMVINFLPPGALRRAGGAGEGAGTIRE